MKRSTERTLTFLLFLVLTIASALIEIWVIYKVVDTGDLSVFKGALSVINGGALAYFIRAFGKLVNRTFIEKDLITEEDLKKFFRNRLDRISGYPNITPENKNIVCNVLLGEVLRMTEEILRNWIGEYQYELSVFTDRDHPKIIAYYETGGQNTPRSMLQREEDPDYYKKNSYKVVELLVNPSNKVITISKTTDPEVNYKFLNQKQIEKIKSTLLYSFCLNTPMALVVVCDVPGVIDKNDNRLINLINAVGMAMKFECNLSSKIY